MKRLFHLVVVAGCLTTGLMFVAEPTIASESSGSKRPLDLPVDNAKAERDDEDSPETILFWGSEYEADAFFICFPAFDF